MGKAERAHRQPLPVNCNLMGTGSGPLPILRREDCFQSVSPNLHAIFVDQVKWYLYFRLDVLVICTREDAAIFWRYNRSSYISLATARTGQWQKYGLI